MQRDPTKELIKTKRLLRAHVALTVGVVATEALTSGWIEALRMTAIAVVVGAAFHLRAKIERLEEASATAGKGGEQ